ncbi:hypothetical protein BpHYR1_019199 [Brachionus plicatilis]|uniref:Uncharacterized protein n=1 Tax=Brachionus plicatilis TaxID=10195 RepID=A0A3M7S5P0_BRAPC|nr:hypothetical protein BpHYR1_019199 [Brachionus plicatilis]
MVILRTIVMIRHLIHSKNHTSNFAILDHFFFIVAVGQRLNQVTLIESSYNHLSSSRSAFEDKYLIH